MVTPLDLILLNLSRILILFFLTNADGHMYNYSQWVTGKNALPRLDLGMAISHYNQNIYLFGGVLNKNQMVMFNINDRSFVDQGTNKLSINVSGLSNQYYTQIYDTFYWLHSDVTNNIIVYNLADQTYKFNIPINNLFDTSSCLTSTNNLLFVSGGTGYVSAVEVFNVTSNMWLSQVPPMHTRRGYHCCVIDPLHDELWIIGGFGNPSGYLDSVEKISIDAIQNQKWKYSHNLTEKVDLMSTIYYQSFIIVIGGWSECSAVPCYAKNIVQTIDSNTGEVSITGYLNYGIRAAAPILVGHTVYLFGGANGQQAVNTFQYLELFTESPTNIPTLNPTESPTNTPTMNPTESPTNTPTMNPTESPTRTNSTQRDVVLIVCGSILCIVIMGMLCYIIVRRTNKSIYSMEMTAVQTEGDVINSIDREYNHLQNKLHLQQEKDNLETNFL